MIRVQKFMVGAAIRKATLADAYTLQECLIARKIISEAGKIARKKKNGRSKPV